MTANAFSIALASRSGAILFLLGKILRAIFFFILLVLLVSQTKVLAGYNLYQTIFFFLTFNLIDTIIQLFLREVYRFRPMVVSGSFDLILTKPFNPLFRILAGGADILDVLMLIPYLLATGYVALLLGPVSFVSIVLYGFLIVNGLVIAIAFHILVAALGVLTTEIDHTIMIYRDITSMGRVPVDIYQEPLRSFLTFVIPVGIMMTYPAKAFLGLLSPAGMIISFVFGAVFFLVNIKLWQYALTKYSSASS